MKNKRIGTVLILIVALIITGCTKDGANQIASDNNKNNSDYAAELFGKDVITVKIKTDKDDWSNLMDNAESKEYIKADVTINGVTYKNVGIKTKGNTSLTQVANTDSDRFSLKLNFDKYVDNQNCYGLDKLVLNNVYGDTTYLKEYMSYELFDYLEVPGSLHTFADIYVNDEHYGFYLALEDVDDSYLSRNYGSDYTGVAYKPESMEMNADAQKAGGGNVGNFVGSNAPRDNKGKPGGFGGGAGGQNGGSLGVNLVYNGDDISSYSNIFDNAITKTDEKDNKRLIETLKAISEGKDLDKYIDVDEVLKYAAVNVFLVNLDSYFSNMGHNYILYEDKGMLSMLPWDYNLSFGTFSQSGNSDAVNYAIDTVFSNVTAEERPVIGLLLQNDEYKEKYHEYLSQLVDYVTSGKFDEKVDTVSKAIDSYVKNDATSFNGYDAFTQGIPVLKEFMKLRSQSVSGQLDGSIPSTTDAQSGSSALIDNSGIDLSKLGGMENDRGMNRGMNNRASGGNNPPSEDPGSTSSNTK